MPNVQQPEVRRSGETRLVQDSDGPGGATGKSPRAEHRRIPGHQKSISETGIKALLIGYDQASSRQADVEIAHATPRVREQLGRSGLQALIS